MATEIKPCKCGREDPNVLHTNLGIGWACLIGCMNADCDVAFIRYGLTKKHAERRAVRAWNMEAMKKVLEKFTM